MTNHKYKPQDNFHEAFGKDQVLLWQERLRDHQGRGSTPQPQDQDDQEHVLGREDIAMEHPVNKTTVRIREDGRLELFVSPETGLVLDPETESIALVGQHIYQVSSINQIRTAPDGWSWNRHAFNADLYNHPSTASEVFHPTTSAERHSPELQGVLDSLDWGRPDA